MNARRFRTLLVVPFLLVLAAGCTVNPVTGEQQLDLMGEAQEIQLGAQLYPTYTQQSLGEVPQAELQAYVNQIGQSLATISHRPRLDWQFNVVNDPHVNAYALPGGKISVTRGLLSRMETEDEIAAVLGHEITHVTARHAAQAYTRQAFTQPALLAGAVYMESQDVQHRDLFVTAGMFGAQMALAHYSREQERQSDDVGFDYMVEAGYNPKGMVELHEILLAQHRAEPGALERMFASHPMTSERIITANQTVLQQPAEITSRPFKQKTFLKHTARVRKARPAYDRLAAGQMALGQKKYGEARQLFEKSVKEWPEDGLLRAFYAISLIELEKPEAATWNAAEAAKDAPELFMVQHIAGQILLHEKKWDAAYGAYQRADSILPNLIVVAFYRARALEGMGRRQEAAKLYQQVRQQAPESEIGKAAHERLRGMGYR